MRDSAEEPDPVSCLFFLEEKKCTMGSLLITRTPRTVALVGMMETTKGRP